METTFEIVVNEKDIDHLGHVNYLEYIHYSESAIRDWYIKAGVSHNDLIENNIGTVVIKFDISYLREARLGDFLKVVTTPLRLGTKSFVLKQDIYNQDNVHITEFNKTFVMFDLLSRKSIPVIDKIARQFPKNEE
ncbi:acyl-CoA thioesterase [Bacillus dakarensis]|uniref:acyl-CoA thioesterase n=1 Tax=Robertmurraya dakarensis TaxID=1926278 RepID=UPI0009812B1C|nr:thioesterase family protein [Bacillus dakarensis]